MQSIFVRPVAGRQIRDPRTMQHLPAAGQLVTAEAYWYRRQADGDVEILDEAPATKEKTTTKERMSI
jgi:hypothetical protein